MSPEERERWSLIAQALADQGHYALTARELPGLAEMVKKAGGRPPSTLQGPKARHPAWPRFHPDTD